MKNFIRVIVVLAIMYLLVSLASMQFDPLKWPLYMVGYCFVLFGVVAAAIIVGIKAY